MSKTSFEKTGKEDNFVNGYIDSEKMDEILLERQLDELIPSVDKLLDTSEKELDIIEEKLDIIIDNIEDEEEVEEVLEGGVSAHQHIQAYLTEKVNYYNTEFEKYKKELAVIKDELSKITKDMKDKDKELTKIVPDWKKDFCDGFLPDDDKACDLYVKYKALEDKHSDIDSKYNIVDKRVVKVYKELIKHTELMATKFRFTPGSSSKITKTNTDLNTAKGDINKLLAISGNYFDSKEITEITRAGQEKRALLAKIIVEGDNTDPSNPSKKLTETDYIKNEDGYRNEYYFWRYILGVKNHTIPVENFLTQEDFYNKIDINYNGKNYELKTVFLEGNPKYKFYVSVKKVNSVTANNPLELYYYATPKIGDLARSKGLNKDEYKSHLWHISVVPGTYTSKDIVNAGSTRGINQKSYVINEGDSRIQKVI
jgi:hypothetical protein